MRALFLIGLVAVAIALPAQASAQRRPQPAPPADPVPVRMSEARPEPLWEGGCFAMVYITSRVWRECCLLCSMGDDSMSAEERAEAAESDGDVIVVKQYFSVTGEGRQVVAEGDTGEVSATEGEDPTTAAAAGDATVAKKKKKRARNKMGGFEGLSGLSAPRLGGFDSE